MKDRVKAFLNRHPFFKNIAVLISGNVIGYGIYMVFLPVLSRIFGPVQMGEYDLILSSGRFVLDFISLGLIMAVMLPKEDDNAKDICQIVLFLNVGFLLVFISILFAIRNVYHLFDTSIPYGLSVILLALYLFAFNLQALFYSYTNRSKKYRVLFWNPIVQNVANVGISITLGIMGFGTTGYLMGTVAAYIICTIHMRFFVQPFHTKISIKKWKKRLREYKDIPLVQLPANVISQIGTEIPTQYLGRVFGSGLLGGYTMANRILSIPVSLLATPINRVVYQTMAAKRNSNEDVGDFCFGVVEKNIKLAILPVGVLIVFSRPLIPWVLGKEWVVAGDYIAILGVMFLLKFCSACVSGTFVVMGRQKLSLVMSFVNLAIYGACFGLSYVLGFNVRTTVLIFSVSECMYQILNLVLCVYCTHYSMQKFIKFLLKYIIGGNVIIYLVYFVMLKVVGTF
ncbi:oligosaccharide flippase family protein [Butyrivibrio sp. CB08]|uniref:oligosaccharide flippase family protein n=1 Tax=Butyrivibrio sp. CB08 TaxID=2364879 RepID=UPI001314750C|nr:oligosaccharide flippase family protein [Butyrivibrio sp. CB08]